jgi:hypothetical protein
MVFSLPKKSLLTVGLLGIVCAAPSQGQVLASGQTLTEAALPAPVRDASGSSEALPDVTPRNKLAGDADSSLAKSQTAAAAAVSSGVFDGARLTVGWRNFFEHLDLVGGGTRQAWVQGMQANFESGFTPGVVGLGFDVSPFAAVKLDGGQGDRNMVHVGPNGTEADKKAWAYLGTYALKVKLPGVLIKHGLQSLSNPFLEPYDIRALPPTFRGTSAAGALSGALALSAGSFDAVNARGSNFLQPLSTTYGGISFRRFNYLGADWQYAGDGKLSLYSNQARDVWKQHYAALSHSVGDASAVKWTGDANLYVTRDQGARLQGLIDTKAYSLSLTATHRASSLMLGYQRIAGDQFFDFVQETSGIFLANAMGTDFNGPHERSIQLRYKFNGDAAGMPGFQAMAWAISGRGADGSVEAGRYADPASSLHDLYWKAGQPVGGSHQEYAFKPSYTVQAGSLKGSKVSILLIVHHVSPLYPSKSFQDVRLMVDVPFNIF